MNKLIPTLQWLAVLSVVLLLVCFSSCGRGKNKQQKHAVDSGIVYICSGPSAKRYHSVDDCIGLSRCSGEVLTITVYEAEDAGKTKCRMCVK